MNTTTVVNKYNLQENDIIEIPNNGKFAVVRHKRKNMLAIKISDGKTYNIPYGMLPHEVEVVGKHQTKSVDQKEDLKNGDLFVINDRGNALLLRFKSFNGDKIIASNPLNGTKMTISRSFTCTLVSAL